MSRFLKILTPPPSPISFNLLPTPLLFILLVFYFAWIVFYQSTLKLHVHWSTDSIDLIQMAQTSTIVIIMVTFTYTWNIGCSFTVTLLSIIIFILFLPFIRHIWINDSEIDVNIKMLPSMIYSGFKGSMHCRNVGNVISRQCGLPSYPDKSLKKTFCFKVATKKCLPTCPNSFRHISHIIC